MLSLGAVKDGVILPSEEDRKRIITQMKVRTTLKGDKSWIQQRSGGEEEQNRSPLRSPVRNRGTNGRSPVSPRNLSPNRRTTSVESPSQAELQSSVAKSPPRKSPSATSPGYLIRGVFTKTVDKTVPSNTASNGSPKSAKTASLPRVSPGYKMSTEEYKKLAPYNVKREPTDPRDAEHLVSPDEQKKRTEFASTVLRRSAGKERSYVFSAAKKSNGSSSQDAPSFLAKRVDVEDETGPRSRSQTVPASGWFSRRGKSTNTEKTSTSESPWSEPRMANAASATSVDTGSKSQAAKPSSESSSTFNHFSSLESSYRRSGDQEKGELLSSNDCAPKVTTSSKSSENGGKLPPAPGAEKRGVIFSEDSYKAEPKSVTESQIPQAPRITISPEASPKSRPSGHYRTSDADTTVETHRRPKVGEYMSDVGSDFPSSSALDQKEGNSFRDVKYGSPNSRVSEFSEHQPVTARSYSFARDSVNAIPGERYNVPIHLGGDEDVGPSRSFSGFERKSTQEMAYESPSDTEYKRVEAHLAKTGSFSSESSLSTTGTQSEFLRDVRRDESELGTARSSSISTGSGVATPENQYGEYGYDSDTARRVASGMPEIRYRTPSYLDKPVYNSCVLESERRTSSYLDCQPTNTIRSGTSHGMPSYLSNYSHSASNLEMSHGITSHLSNQAFDSGRSYYPFRDNCAAASPRSHRVPFYKDICDPEVGSSKGLLFVKELVNSTELSSSPRYNSRSMVDLSDLERSTYSSATSLNSSTPKRHFEDICTYCGREIRNCPKITIENLKICCHEYCFRCGICHKPMGDLLDKIFIHRDIVHCDKCYEKLF